MNESTVVESKQFQDEYGYLHTTKAILGQGGQGIVYRTHDVDLAIKLPLKGGEPLNHPHDIRQAKKSFNRLKYLPLETLKISTPIALLEQEFIAESPINTTGYIMRLMADMRPFSDFIFGEQTPQDIKMLEIPNYLQDTFAFANNMDILQRMAFYIATHGVKRRLKALYRCALVLHQLHSRGLFFADINPNNEFLSNDLEYEEVWLIDADNIYYDDPNNHQVDIYFPKYGAPEVVTHKAKSSIVSDCYSFAILSHIILTQHHPFDGIAITENENAGWDDDNQNNEDFSSEVDKSETGELAWILSRHDNSNQNLIPLGFVIQEPEIFKLFEQTFEQGKFDIYQRPTMNLWVIALAKLHDRLLSCPNCHFTFATLADETCELCQMPRPAYLNIEVFNQQKAKVWQFVHGINDSEIQIPTRLVSSVDTDEGYISLLEVTVTDKHLLLTKKHRDWDCSILGTSRSSSWVYTFKTALVYDSVIEIQALSKNHTDQNFILQLSIKK